MYRKKLITFFVGCCVLLAPALSNANAPAPITQTQDQATDCHSAAAAAATLDSHAAPDGAHGTSVKVTHSCCVSFVGAFTAVNLVQPYQGVSEPIPFKPSLSLSSRVEGLFRPPRQFS